MCLHVYIDEAGDFEEGTRRSSVMAVMTRNNRGTIERLLRGACAKFNEENGTDFSFPDDMHCAPLIMATDYQGRSTGRYQAFSQETRYEFIETILDTVLVDDVQLAASQSPSDRIDYDPQHNYVDNLFAVVWRVLEGLAEGTYIVPGDLSKVHIVIATRRGLRPDLIKNEDKLREYLQRSCKELAGRKGNQQVISLLEKVWFGHEVAERHAGLIAADFCAYYWRGTGPVKRTDLRSKLQREIWDTGPDDPNRVQLREGVDLLIKSDLNDLSDFGALYSFALEFNDTKTRDFVLSRLGHLKDPSSIFSQCANLLRCAERLIEGRLENSAYLDEAQTLCKALRNVTGGALEADDLPPEDAKNIAELHLKSIDGLVCCANHAGDNTSQQKLRNEFDQKLTQHTDLIGGYRHARELDYELQNRFCNLYANEYRFEEMVDAADGLYQEITQNLPDGQADELVGKLSGTLGQAYAFMARTDPEWADEAKKLFKESLRHFPEKSVYYSMSVNYLATLAWQQGDNAAAARYMAQHPGMEEVSAPGDLWQCIPNLIDNKRDFDLVNVLRILASEAWQGNFEISSKTPDILGCLQQIHEYVKDPDRCQHPVHQIHKWLAVLQLVANRKKDALANTDAALAKAKKLGFTIHTIAPSILPVRYRAGGYNLDDIEKMKNQISLLADRVKPFSEYVYKLGGAGELARLARSDDDAEFWQAITYPPFAYV